MAENSWAASMRRFGAEAKRSAERTTQSVMNKMGYGSSTVRDPEFEEIYSVYKAQVSALKDVKMEALGALEFLRKYVGATHALSCALREGVEVTASYASGINDLSATANSLVAQQSMIADEILQRAEKRIQMRILTPIDDELLKSRDVAARVDMRKTILLDFDRYRARYDSTHNPGDKIKADSKLQELEASTRGLLDTFANAVPVRVHILSALTSECIEFQRRFYVEASKRFEGIVESIGTDKLASMRVGQSGDSSFLQTPQKESIYSFPQAPDDDGDEEDIFGTSSSFGYTNSAKPPPISRHKNAFEDSRTKRSSTTSNNTNPYAGSFEEAQRNAAKATTRRATTSNLFDNISTASTTTSQSQESDIFGFNSKPANKSQPAQDDLIGVFADATTSRQAENKKKSGLVSSHFEDLMNLGKSNSTFNETKKTTTTNPEDDLLGMFSSGDARGKPRKATSGTTNLFDDLGKSAPTFPKSSAPPNASPSPPPKESAPTQPTPSPPSRKETPTGTTVDRAAAKQKEADEIKARADEKLAEVKKREEEQAHENRKKDEVRDKAEAKVDTWTGKGTRRGNIRQLLANLDSVLWPGTSWTPVTMDVLQNKAKVKINYHKSILIVHPDKVGSDMTPEQKVLAELIFDELKNAWEVHQCELEGKPPPEGSVGPKGARGGMGGGGMGGMGGMGNMGGMGGMGNMGGMSGMGNMGGMGGMGMGGMGGMYGPGMGNMGGGMYSGGMGTMGGGMYGGGMGNMGGGMYGGGGGMGNMGGGMYGGGGMNNMGGGMGGMYGNNQNNNNNNSNMGFGMNNMPGGFPKK